VELQATFVAGGIRAANGSRVKTRLRSPGRRETVSTAANDHNLFIDNILRLFDRRNATTRRSLPGSRFQPNRVEGFAPRLSLGRAVGKG